MNRSVYFEIILLFFVILVCAPDSWSQEDYFLTLSNSRVRSIAMGGAFTAIDDDLNSISYNPATFTLFQIEDRRRRLSVFVNPILPVVALEQAERFDPDMNNTERVFNSLKYFVKGISYSNSFLNAGILLNEERFMVRGNEYFFDGLDYSNNVFHSIVMNFKLSTQANFGVSGSFVQNKVNENIKESTMISYGLLVRPSLRYQVGITFFDMSNDIKSMRRRFERFADESLNIGMAFFPFEGGTLSIDARNVTESDDDKNFALQEFHFGAEFSKIRHFSLRAGFYREEFSLEDNLEFAEAESYDFSNKEYANVFSFGIGIIDLNVFRSYASRFNHPTPLISYSMILKDTPLGRVNWHFLSMSIRIN
ncbi:MAG: hypothetical protein GY863_02915 [bacterium]|nr:hypothetical protein [bacterium]